MRVADSLREPEKHRKFKINSMRNFIVTVAALLSLVAVCSAGSCIAPDGRDLSGLIPSTPFSLSDEKYLYSFSLCSTALPTQCDDASGGIACQTLRPGNSEILLARASTEFIEVIDRGYSFSYKNGDNERTVEIQVTCNPSAPAIPSDWSVINDPRLSYTFSATSSAVCLLCKADDGTDVSRLASPTGIYYVPIPNQRAVLFQVCTSLPMNCQGYANVSACVFAGNEQYALGTTASQNISATGDGFSFSYASAVPGSRVTILFNCGGGAGSPSEWTTQNSGNTWIFSTKTQLACPPAPAGSCVANDGFSLARLNNPGGFKWFDGSKYTYFFSLCSPLANPCNFNPGAAGCQVINNGVVQLVMGQASSSEITRVSGGYLFRFINGDAGRTFSITVSCDPLLNRQLEIQSVDNTAPSLNYQVAATSPYACHP